jgi:hypothetical protein
MFSTEADDLIVRLANGLDPGDLYDRDASFNGVAIVRIPVTERPRSSIC